MEYPHVIPPNYFDEVIEQFSFDYEWWHTTSLTIDDYGNQKNTYMRMALRGSLQPQNQTLRRDKSGNQEQRTYRFYCKSIYRIDTGDFINYNNIWLICTGIELLDEYGVRVANLESTDMSLYRDLMEAVKAQTGEIIV